MLYFKSKMAREKLSLIKFIQFILINNLLNCLFYLLFIQMNLFKFVFIIFQFMATKLYY